MPSDLGRYTRLDRYVWLDPPPELSGVLVLSLGWVPPFGSGVGVLLAVLTVPRLIARINAEATLMRSEFAGEYDAYCCRTSPLIPGLC